MAQKRKNRIIIPCRFAYFNCWRPSSIYGNNKYSMSAIISKDDTETLDSIYDAIEYVKEKSMTNLRFMTETKKNLKILITGTASI